MPKQSARKRCVYSNDSAITLNILELVCENCLRSLNNLEFRKYLFIICHVHYTKMWHSMFRHEKEAVAILNELVELGRCAHTSKLSAMDAVNFISNKIVNQSYLLNQKKISCNVDSGFKIQSLTIQDCCFCVSENNSKIFNDVIGALLTHRYKHSKLPP